MPVLNDIRRERAFILRGVGVLNDLHRPVSGSLAAERQRPQPSNQAVKELIASYEHQIAAAVTMFSGAYGDQRHSASAEVIFPPALSFAVISPKPPSQRSVGVR